MNKLAKTFLLSQGNKQRFYDLLKAYMSKHDHVLIDFTSCDPRSIMQNRLLHQWIRLYANERGIIANDIYKHWVKEFYEPHLIHACNTDDVEAIAKGCKLISQTRPVIISTGNQLWFYKSTRLLSADDMRRFMTSIEQWCADDGVPMPTGDTYA